MVGVNDRSQVDSDEIYLNMNGRLIRVVEEGLVWLSDDKTALTIKLIEDMWTGEIFEPRDFDDVYVAKTFNEMELIAMMARGPLHDV